MKSEPVLPVRVLSVPHWRVNFRPATYEGDRLKDAKECAAIVEKTRVRLRGWDFPHLSSHGEIEYAKDWLASWSDFMGHLEYWRFYRSTQFLYLGSVRELTEPDWDAKLRRSMHRHSDAGAEIDNTPGFLSIVEFTYNMTEIFEFAARLAQAELYLEPLTIDIRIKGIKGFMLAADEHRAWSSGFTTSQETLHYEVSLAPADLVANAASEAINSITTLFEYFGWDRPNVDALSSIQQKLLTRQF